MPPAEGAPVKGKILDPLMRTIALVFRLTVTPNTVVSSHVIESGSKRSGPSASLSGGMVSDGNTHRSVPPSTGRSAIGSIGERASVQPSRPQPPRWSQPPGYGIDELYPG